MCEFVCSLDRVLVVQLGGFGCCLFELLVYCDCLFAFAEFGFLVWWLAVCLFYAGRFCLLYGLFVAGCTFACLFDCCGLIVVDCELFSLFDVLRMLSFE